MGLIVLPLGCLVSPGLLYPPTMPGPLPLPGVGVGGGVCVCPCVLADLCVLVLLLLYSGSTRDPSPRTVPGVVTETLPGR